MVDNGRMTIRAFSDADAEAWDVFAHDAWNATFLHSRRFLGYHGARFTDASTLVIGPAGDIWGVLPAAVSPTDPSTVVSHPGATFGGLVHAGELRGPRCLEAFDEIAAHYRALGFHTLDYRPVPLMYHRRPAQDDLYALFRNHGERYRVDLSSTIDLSARSALSKGRKGDVKKAQRVGLVLEDSPDGLTEFWPLLIETLKVRYGTLPVHDIDEMAELAKLFPEEIRCIVGRVDGEVVTGTVLFMTQCVAHTQYLASSERGRELGVLGALIEQLVGLAHDAGARYFDLGTSNEEQGWVLNETLHDYKRRFGAGGVVHEFYRMSL